MPRPKSYEPERALRSAMELFWMRGYESTSIPMLESHLGINRYGIYDTFENKRTLFLRALDAYAELLVAELVGPLESGTHGKRDLAKFWSAFEARFIAQPDARGCLICNTAAEIGDRDPDIAKRVAAYFDRLERALAACLSRAHDLGEVGFPPRLLRARATLARTTIQGLLIDVRLGRPQREIRRALAILKSTLAATTG